MEETKVEIRLIVERDLEQFFAYLSEQLAENGRGANPLFQPQSPDSDGLTKEMEQRFTSGMIVDFPQSGWRRVWGAFDKHGVIMGHIDLRGHPEAHTQHRALLGMGVHRDARRMGLGHKLIRSVKQWAIDEAEIEWIDLWVLSENLPAIGLYQAAGFIKNGELEDMFRIDARSYAYTRMSCSLK
ncbi:N-acetyltransferase [Shewanella canadensis]|uniref:N-acetyltransferase n=1 Tax=Shewanella canadensis TaxID=271096 RepID=A0A431X0C5_9GAMM|nr:GNAT family N-acetyltransferase [Shewanella canadensis]RTR40903.1 N-acetyltransferase [Shewanella canadensis]